MRGTRWSLTLGICLVVSACAIVRAPTRDELAALDNPPADVAAKVDGLFARALAWYDAIEAELLPQGRPLTDAEQDKARQLGVIQPERVRVVILEPFPLPEDPELLEAARSYGLGSRLEGGRTIGQVIMLKPRYRDSSTILAHELIHVTQHDRLGRAAFLRRYLVELEMMGYARAPLELEAYSRQNAAE